MFHSANILDPATSKMVGCNIIVCGSQKKFIKGYESLTDSQENEHQHSVLLYYQYY